VRRSIKLLDIDGGSLDGLLIEVFTDGCRISNVNTEGLNEDRNVTLSIEGFEDIAAQVHCANNGIVRLRFVRPLAAPRLRSLVGSTRKRPSTFEPGFFFAA
jgi:hypothetical protein